MTGMRRPGGGRPHPVRGPVSLRGVARAPDATARRGPLDPGATGVPSAGPADG